MDQNTKYDISVKAVATFVPEQSDEQDNRYVFAYTITITNTGGLAAQLLRRHWIITDASNQVQEVSANREFKHPFSLPLTLSLSRRSVNRHR